MLGAIIGSVITTVGNILVSMIQSRKEHTDQAPGILVPQNYVLRRPKKHSFWLVVFIIVSIVVSITLSVVLVYMLGLNSPEQTSNLLTLETIQFDYPDSPLQHDWKLVEGNTELIAFTQIVDPKVGNALRITSPEENFYGLDLELNPRVKEFGDYLEVVSRYDDESASIYTYIGMTRIDGAYQTGWLKYKLGEGGPLPSQKTTGENEWVLYLTPESFSNTNWVKLQVDLDQAVHDTYGTDDWSFDKLLKFRIRGNITIDNITIYERVQ